MKAELPVNHEEAIEYAHLHKVVSNLARCYIELATPTATTEGEFLCEGCHYLDPEPYKTEYCKVCSRRHPDHYTPTGERDK